MTLCTATRRDGTPCKAAALPGRQFCCFHDPSLRQRCAAGRQKGGLNRPKPVAVLPLATPDYPLTSWEEVTDLLSRVANWTLRGQIDAKIGNSVANTLSVLTRVWEQSDVEKRLAELEKYLAEAHK